MKRREGLLLSAAAIAAAIGVWGYFFLPLVLVDIWESRLWLSILTLSTALFIREVLLRAVLPRIGAAYGRYLLLKVTLAVFWGITLYVLIHLWVLNVSFLPVTLGLLAAGLAVAFQRPIMSLLGVVVLLVNRPFRVGDRIEVKGLRGETLTRGDVIDIKALYTSILEVGEWMGGDVWTGRIVTVPNYRFLENEVANSTKEFGYIWDIVAIPITFTTDIRKARLALVASIEKVVGHLKKPAREDLRAMAQRYYSTMEETDPRAYVTIKESWIELGARYITVPRGRRTIRSRIQQDFLERIRGDPDICLASPEMRIYNFPPEEYRRGLSGELGAEAEEEEEEAPPAPEPAELPPTPPHPGRMPEFTLTRDRVGQAAAERKGRKDQPSGGGDL